MANPYRPGTVYYADVPEAQVRDCESRDNPAKGPRPWIVLYCRQHGRTGVVLAAPLHSRGDSAVPSHVRYTAEQFDELPGDAPGILQDGYIKLEQIRALDKERLHRDRGALACMKRNPFTLLRGHLMGMLDPRYVRTTEGSDQ